MTSFKVSKLTCVLCTHHFQDPPGHPVPCFRKGQPPFPALWGIEITFPLALPAWSSCPSLRSQVWTRGIGTVPKLSCKQVFSGLKHGGPLYTLAMRLLSKGSCLRFWQEKLPSRFLPRCFLKPCPSEPSEAYTSGLCAFLSSECTGHK